MPAEELVSTDPQPDDHRPEQHDPDEPAPGESGPASGDGTLPERRILDIDETVVVVTGAAPLDAAVVATLPRSDHLIAADGALDHALAAGLHPDVVIGDLDSISAEGLAWAEANAEVERYAPDKDATDTELALALAAERSPRRIVLVSGGGDRIDHTLAAIGALGAPGLTSVPELWCWWGGQELHVLQGPGRIRLDVTPGSTVSLLATHGPCTGVTTTGLRWALDAAELAPLAGLGVSNVAEAAEVSIAVSSGVLTVTVADGSSGGAA
jgi:thiamine pyrophosphokinase